MNQDAPINKIDNCWYTGLYLQDDFRVHPRVTLNLGLRYDLQLPMRDPQDRLVTFVPGSQSTIVPTAPPGLLFPGDAGVQRGIVRADTNNFAPRVGVAWDPFGDGKTSVRSAFGVFYGAISGNALNQVADRQPFTGPPAVQQRAVADRSVCAAARRRLAVPVRVQSGEPALSAGGRHRRHQPGFQVAVYLPDANFTIERQIGRDVSVSAGYVGTLARKFTFNRDVNYPVFGPGATAGNVNQRRPYNPGLLSTVQVIESSANSAYHAMLLTAEKRMARSFSFKAFTRSARPSTRRTCRTA